MKTFQNLDQYEKSSEEIKKKNNLEIVPMLEYMCYQIKLDHFIDTNKSMIKENFQKSLRLEFSLEKYLSVVFKENNSFITSENYKAMISSKLFTPEKNFIPNYNFEISIQKNFSKARTNWTVQKNNIKNYAARHKQIEDACRI